MNTEEIDFLRSCAPNEESFQKLQQYIQKEKRFRHFSDESIDGIIISQNSVIIDANSAVSGIYGYTFDEILGRTVFDFVTPESGTIALHNIQNGFNDPYELAGVHKDGHIFPIEVAGKTIEYDGEPYRITIVRDITERKQQEQKLQNSIAKISALFENTTDSVWSVDREYCLTAYNSVYEQIFLKRFGQNLRVGLALHEAVPEEIYKQWVDRYERALNGEQFSFEYDIAFNGEIRNREISLNPIISEGIITGVVGFGRDITEKSRSYTALKNSQANISAVIENTSDAIWSIDDEYRLTTCNSRYEEGFFKRYGKQLTLGVKLLELIPDDSYQLWKPLYDRAFKGERFSFEHNYEQDGEIRFREVSFNPIISGDRVTGVTSFGHDITDRKRSEKSLQDIQSNIAALIENTTDSIWSVDRELRLVTFNTAFAKNCFKIHGLLVAPGMYVAEIFKDTFGSMRTQYEGALKGERSLFDFELQQGDKALCWELSLSPITTRGKITGVVTFGRDITERKSNEEALKKSQAAISGLIENTKDSVWSVDPEYRLITYNSVFKDHFFKAYGTYPQEGDAIKDILPRDVFEHWLPIYSRAFKGEHFTTENETEYKGHRHYTEVSLNPIITNKKITGVATYSRDITERKESELALKTSQANTITLIENTDASFWSVNTDYQVLILNKMYSYLYHREYGVHLKIGDSAFKGLTPGNTAYWTRLYERCFAGENISFDVGYDFKGEQQYYNVTLNPITTDEVITGAVCSSREITERKRTEEKMREHSALLDIANEAIIVRDLNARVTFWNRAAERMYGWTAKEALGRIITDLVYNKETIPSFKEAWEELMLSGQWNGELLQTNKNGKILTAYCRWTLVFDAHGKPKSILAIDNDITEQKSLQQQFYRSQRLESLGTLASGIAHDLNNILTPILLSVEILRIKYPEDKNSRMLETIEVSAKRGSDIVKQVLMFASGVSGERTSVLLIDSIREIAMIVRKTFSKSIELSLGVSQSVQPILGDSTQIQQILMNLCVNARDAMPQGGEIRIDLDSKTPTSEIFATTPDARSMEYTVLKVSDTGTGIPQDIIDRIFDPFFTTKEVGSGTGLGLSTVNAIVEGHNGFLKVFNNPDRGASFEIWFPAYYEKEREAIPQGESTIILSGKGKTVLIVDDEPLILQLISYSLERFGFTILTANNGGEALLAFKENPGINLVITDVNMPGMDGLALVGESMNIDPLLKFIIMTGLPINNRMDEMKTIGVSSFLTKPFKTQVLLKAIEIAFQFEEIHTSFSARVH